MSWMIVHLRRLRSHSALLLAALVVSVGTACGDSAGSSLPTTTPEPSASAIGGESEGVQSLGRGFVVWESNRGGRWRIWRRGLDGSEPTALTPDEPGKAHCCAHVSPDGRQMAYLALPQGQADYPESGAAGELRLLDLELGTSRVLSARARTYFEHRAAVWHDDRTLVHIDAEGRTVSRDVDSGDTRALIDQPQAAHGWLVDRSQSFASQGMPTFSRFDQASGKVRTRPHLGGCQPYFAYHAALGVWVAGAGGPIRAIDLASRRQWPLLAKGDERLPADRRYLYFPMPSRDGRHLSWAASDGTHDHERADYDVFVAETDPETLELLGPPWRATHHRATDRFPDVWTEPLALGRHDGEAPFEATLRVPADAAGDDWSWQTGAGPEVRGRSVTATWEQPGRLWVRAQRGDTVLYGTVHIRAPAPPKILEVDVHPGRDQTMNEIRVRFDEPVNVESASASLGRGAKVVSSGLRDGDTVWVLRLEEHLERPDRLV
ncbi:MAG: hypothetical protein MPN21_00085, partial [Thermoanaerobaculia bacterium]|nr:hypothetical protein [Thermoanaerobaculia bacterium]